MRKTTYKHENLSLSFLIKSPGSFFHKDESIVSQAGFALDSSDPQVMAGLSDGLQLAMFDCVAIAFNVSLLLLLISSEISDP